MFLDTGRNGSSLLNSDDLHLFLEIAEACHSLTPLHFTEAIYPKLRKLLPHQGFLCAAVHPLSGRVQRYINISFPQRNLGHCDEFGTSLHCALVKKWVRTGKPVFHEKSNPAPHKRDIARTTPDEPPLYNVAVHGVNNGPRRHASCYVFANLDGAWRPRQMLILKLITPHLHALFMPALRGETPGPALHKPLSAREHDVLEALVAGNSGVKIAKMLNISISTVRVHIRHILGKLDANNIVSAVAKAQQTGLLARRQPLASERTPGSDATVVRRVGP